MIKFFLLLLFLFTISSINAQNTYIPDDKFENALIRMGYDTLPLNDSVPTVNIDTIKILKISDKQIRSLEGIYAFKALEELSCGQNSIREIDLSANTALRKLAVIRFLYQGHIYKLFTHI